jgi:hypothetical protein
MKKGLNCIIHPPVFSTGYWCENALSHILQLKFKTSLLFRPFCFIAPQNFKLFGFPIFPLWAYLMKVFPETRRAH